MEMPVLDAAACAPASVAGLEAEPDGSAGPSAAKAAGNVAVACGSAKGAASGRLCSWGSEAVDSAVISPDGGRLELTKAAPTRPPMDAPTHRPATKRTARLRGCAASSLATELTR